MPFATQSVVAAAQCPNCGAEVSVETERCPSCGRTRERSSRIILVVTLLALCAGFAMTHYLVALHRATELSLARRWFVRGEQAMQANMPKGAAEAYRTALNYDRENQEYRLRLAQALMAEHTRPSEAEARAHLLSLWEEEPANGEVNLTLARLSAQRSRFSDAVRYYNDAINGVWESHPRQHRTDVRFELTRYLLQQHNPARAQAELLALLADAPSDPADQLRLGQMLLEVNEPQHALQAYNTLLAGNADNPQAWLGAGQAYLELGNYAEAERASARAVAGDPNLDSARNQLELARELLRINPAQRGLPLAERANRAARGFEAALKRLNECALEQKIDLASPGADAPGGNASAPPPNALQLLYSSGLRKQIDATPQALRNDPDAIEPIMQYVFDVQRTTAPVCPSMSLTDRALLVLAQREGEPTR